nr:NTP transferase domain-containing protein [Ornithinimicrobium sediminis]
MTVVAQPVPYDVVVLAGGRGERLGGVDKAQVQVGGVSLLDRALSATAGARQRVVVAPERAGVDGVVWTLEEPAGGGPVAGVVAGLAGLGEAPAPWVLVLAVDQPGLEAVVPRVLEVAGSAGPDVDAVCPRDAEGMEQWLLAAYRTSALQQAVAEVGTGHGVSVRRTVSGLRTADVPEVRDHLGDVDTPADLRRWRESLG